MTDLAARRFQREIRDAIDSRRLAGANVLDNLTDAVFNCSFPEDVSREAVAYGLFTFLARMAEAHQNDPTFTNAYADLFLSATETALIKASEFLVQGGTSSDAVQIIAELYGADRRLGKEFPGH